MRVNNERFVYYKDMYNIYNLITKIDNGYRLIFDKKTKMFIIINTAKNNQICYKTDVISPEIIKVLKISRVENINKIIKEIDIQNEKISKSNEEKIKFETIEKTVDLLNFSKRTSRISNYAISKILGEKIC